MRVKQAGFHGRVEIIKEVARRWKLAKQFNTPAAPLMITPSSGAGSSEEAASETDSTPDALIDALKEELSELISSSGERYVTHSSENPGVPDCRQGWGLQVSGSFETR